MPKLSRKLHIWTEFWFFKFFRQRLLTLKTQADVINFVESYDIEVKAIKQELLRICWYMRGGITYSEAALLSNQERNIIGEIIKENLEISKESKMPFW